MLVQIVIESKGRSERRLVDVTTGVVTIGRAPTCTLPIESTLISRTHVSVDLNGQRMRVTDSSTNGTLAGDRFVRGSSADVPFGVPIVLGDHTVWLEASDPSVAKTFESASEKAQRPTQPAPLPTPTTSPRSPVVAREVYEVTLLQFFAPVRPYLDDPAVRAIMINGPDQIYVERRGFLEHVPAAFASREALLAAVKNLSQYVGKPLDEAHPMLEGRLPDGSRIDALIPPLSPDGPQVVIRRFFKEAFALEHLVQGGSLSRVAAAALQAMVVSKLNIVVAGGIGSGKTSMLRALLGFIPDGERVVILEDSRELQFQQPHVVQVEARPLDAQGHGVLPVRDALRAALGMRPDRLVIGEIRGAEALDIVEAMTSGHRCMGTLLAAHPRGALTRLEALCATSDVGMPIETVRQQIGSGVQLVVQMSRLQDGSRSVSHVTEIVGFDAGSQRYATQDLFVRQYRGRNGENRVESELVPTGTEPTFLPQLKEHGCDLPEAMRGPVGL
jgi:pilus assembly protein CpaF